MNALQILLLIILAEIVIYSFSRTGVFRRISERLNIEFAPYGFYIRKPGTLDFLDRLVSNRVLRFLAVVGVPAMVVSMILFYYGVYFVGIQFVLNIARGFIESGQIVSDGGGTPPVVPILPGVTVFGVDIIYILIAIGLGVVFHELGHALVSKMERVPLKSYGAGLMLIIPFAFVEVDESVMNRSRRSALKILSGGIMANLVIFAMAFGGIYLISGVAPLFGIEQGLIVDNVEPGSLADRYGIEPGLLIVRVNDRYIDGLDDFLYLRSLVSVNDTVEIYIEGIYPDGRVFNETIVKPADVNLLGIYIRAISLPFGYISGALIVKGDSGYTHLAALEEVIRFLMWVVIINLSLAVINAAPLFITDGGKFLSILFSGRKTMVLQLVTVLGFIAIFVISLVIVVM